ncbi:MAG: alpha/beta hydrolase [Deltaproteobacteria bacterium]|nr:alpha/beta hydrolase [Deltaproteobacteria bacterium]
MTDQPAAPRRESITVPGLFEVPGLVLGEGELTLLLHGSADSASCWRGVMPRVPGRVVAPSLVAARESMGGPTAGEGALRVDVRWLMPLLEHLKPRAVVGHSYGALLALRARLAGAEVGRLVLIEPIAFGLLEGPDRAAIDTLNDGFFGGVARGDLEGGLRGLVDYWNGPGAFDALPASARQRLILGADHTQAEVRSGLEDRTHGSELASLAGSLVLAGEHTTPESQRVCELLARGLGGECETIAGAGHQGPRSHPEAVASAVVEWLER